MINFSVKETLYNLNHVVDSIFRRCWNVFNLFRLFPLERRLSACHGHSTSPLGNPCGLDQTKTSELLRLLAQYLIIKSNGWKNIVNAKWFSTNKEGILKQVSIWKLSPFRVPDSIPSTNPSKNMAERNLMQIHRLVSLLDWMKTTCTATCKTVIRRMQSLGLENFLVVYTRFFVFYSDNALGNSWWINAGKRPCRASLATHPWNETGWPPKLLARFSSWGVKIHNDMQDSQ